MNAQQRRKAYRAQPQAGTFVEWFSINGTRMQGTVIGPMPIHADKWNEERANVPNVCRVRVRLNGGSFVHPLMKKLRVTH